MRLGQAWTTFRGRRLLVLRARLAATGRGRGLAAGEIDPSTLEVGTGGGGALALVEVQPEGKARPAGGGWRNGARLQPGERLGPDRRSNRPEPGTADVPRTIVGVTCRPRC